MEHMITDTQFLNITDQFGLAASRLTGDVGTSAGHESGTVHEALYAAKGLIAGTGDDAFELDVVEGVPGTSGMRQAIAQVIAGNRAAVIQANQLGRLIGYLENYLQRNGVVGTSDTIDRFCTFLNGGSTPDFTCLLSPDFAALYYAAKWGPETFDAGYWPTPANVFSPLLSAMGAYVVGSGFTAGSAVDITRYAAVEPVGKLTVSTNGTCAITVTGKNQDGTASRTWTGAADSVTAPADITLTPTVGTDRLTQVTGIAVAGDATAGTFHIESLLERTIT